MKKFFIVIIISFSITKFKSQSSCNNIDFENLIPSVYNGSLSVQGWTLTAGSSTGNAASCNLQNCCIQNAYLWAYNQVLIDPIIGSAYPVKSPFNHKPTFVRIGTDTALGRATRLRKSMLIGSSNELVQIAFLSVLENASASSCCELPGLLIKFFNSSGPIPCFEFSVTPSSNFCNNNSGITFSNALHPNIKYNPWKIQSFDLSAYNGQNVTLEITVFNGNPGGKMAYAYIDAECGPLILSETNMTGIGLPSSGPIYAFSCGSPTTTLKAPVGFHAYAWGGSGFPLNYSVLSATNDILPNIPTGGTYTFSYQVLPNCPVIQRQIIYQSTGGINLQYVVQNPACNSTVGAIHYTVGGALPGNFVVKLYDNFSQLSSTVSAGVNSINTTPLSPGVYSFDVISSFSCIKHQTVEIKPYTPFPTFTVGTPSNSYTLNCANSPIIFTANVQSPHVYSYTWTTSGNTLTGQGVLINQPGLWNVKAWSPATNCSLTTSFIVYQNNTPPSLSLNPTLATVSCNTLTVASATGIASSTAPVSSQWYFKNAGTLIPVGSPQGSINVLTFQHPGQYVFTASNNINGCSSSQTLNVNSSSGVPAFTLSNTGFSFGCIPATLTSIHVSSVLTSPLPGMGVEYALSPPGATNAPVFGTSPMFNNLTQPGTYTIWVKDITNNCISYLTPNVIQNTIAPTLNYFISPGINQLTCSNPQVTLTGISNSTNALISWTVPAPSGTITFNQASAVAQINPSLTNATSSVVSLGGIQLEAINPVNQCKTNNTIFLTQDIRKPVLTVTSVPASIKCSAPDVVLTNAQASAVLNSLLITTYCWQLPQVPNLICVTQAVSAMPGTHTCLATSGINGCTTTQTYNVNADFSAAPVTNAGSQFTLSCPPNNTLNFCVNFTSGSLPVNWVFASAGYTNTAPNCLNVNASGIYIAAVQNPTSGCITYASYEVLDCTVGLNEYSKIPVRIFPIPTNDKLFIQTETNLHDVLLLDVNGKKYSIPTEKINTHEYLIHLDMLHAGLYLLFIHNKTNDPMIFKVIKQY